MTYAGDLEGFPPEVVDKMLERQKEQGNSKNLAVFEGDRTADRNFGGFDWGITPEDKELEDFWWKVIEEKNFGLFFEYYPTRYKSCDPDFLLKILDI